MFQWANEFSEILPTVRARPDLHDRIIKAMQQDMQGKATEGGNRIEKVREVLSQVLTGELGLEESFLVVEEKIPRQQSIHASSNRVFPERWGERLVRTQLSRHYNQVVLEVILEGPDHRCFVPHSAAEQPNSRCSLMLAGRQHDARKMHTMLVECYTHGEWVKWVKVPMLPDHPHCTHVFKPV